MTYRPKWCYKVYMESVGRPSKYDPKYCNDIIEIMREGASIEEVAAELGVAVKTLYNWTSEHDEFLQAKKMAEELSAAWWKRQGRIALREKEFNYTGWYMNMKNRFGWRDKRDITTDGDKLPTPIFGGASNVSEDDSDN